MCLRGVSRAGPPDVLWRPGVPVGVFGEQVSSPGQSESQGTGEKPKQKAKADPKQKVASGTRGRSPANDKRTESVGLSSVFRILGCLFFSAGPVHVSFPQVKA